MFAQRFEELMSDSDITDIALHDTARHRYLNYAMSVISSRALPDVRDGFKPVQRRILYAMYHNLGLRPDGRFRKSAAVVGEVMAKYHPHGDSSIYSAMVRMAQPFSLRYPLVDGQGNFGSLDGDGAAAMRYTEAKLQPVAVSLLDEIKQSTVEFRANYDGQHWEPEVLPVKFPQMLVNGSEGIAVGMATRIPPHNLREVVGASIALLDTPELGGDDLFEWFLGPDFPTGGKILNTEEDLKEIYRKGTGTVRIRGKWEFEKRGKVSQIVVKEIPYGVNKSTLVEKIGDIVGQHKLPMTLDVRDESAEDIRIVIEIKKPADAEPVMAYLFKRTPLESTFPINMTCLFPTGDENLPLEPRKSPLRDVLQAWLDFRYTVVERRYQHHLYKLRDRIHILEGFEIVYSDLDRALEIIRTNSGKRACAQALIAEFGLSPKQAGVILDTPLYKISKLEIQSVLTELAGVRVEAAGIDKILGDPKEVWAVVRRELIEVSQTLGDDRRTEVGSPAQELDEFSAEDLIVDERAYLFVTREGWVKRMGSYSKPEKVRVREGDELSWVIRSSTRHCATFFTDMGIAYTLRLVDVAPTTSFGEPIQRFFQFQDGEKIVGVVTHDSRILPDDSCLVSMTTGGRIIRFPVSNHNTTSNSKGRKFASLPPGDRVLGVEAASEGSQISVATRDGQALCFPLSGTPTARGAAKGVYGIKLVGKDRVLAFGVSEGRGDGVLVKTSRGREVTVTCGKWAGRRATIGKTVINRGTLDEWVRSLVEVK